MAEITMSPEDLSGILTVALHQIRAHKPALRVAEETGITKPQIDKYRAGIQRVHVEEWVRLIRCIFEVSPKLAGAMAQAALPPELFQAVPVETHPQSVGREVLETAAAAGLIPGKYLDAMRDGTLDSQEKAELRGLWTELQHEAAEGLAALDKADGGVE